MSTKFKRASLVGSDEVFRTTSPAAEDTDDVIAEVLDRRPIERLVPGTRQLSFSPEEVELLLEAIQVSKYPDKARPKPSLDKFERLDEIRAKLQADS